MAATSGTHAAVGSTGHAGATTSMRSTSWTFDRIVSSLLVVTTLLVAGLAAPVAEWTAPAGCPDSEAVYEAAEAFGASVRDASLKLEGRIEPVDGGFRLDLSIRTPTGTTPPTVPCCGRAHPRPPEAATPPRPGPRSSLRPSAVWRAPKASESPTVLERRDLRARVRAGASGRLELLHFRCRRVHG